MNPHVNENPRNITLEEAANATAWARRHRGNPNGQWAVIAGPELRGGGGNYHVVALVGGEWCRVTFPDGRPKGKTDQGKRSVDGYMGNQNSTKKTKNHVDAVTPAV